MKRGIILFTILFISLCQNSRIFSQNKQKLEGRAIWAVPANAGKTEKSVKEFVLKCKKANINIIVMLVKNTGGRIFWHSKKFHEAIDPNWKDFDMLKYLVDEAHKYGIRVHAWFCDFPEGKDSPAYKNYPEWAMLNPEGKTTTSEFLANGRPYYMVWMCPARRPGYTDQWLIPMIEEVTRLYNIDGIHHDYVRYPGDVAPNDYCFCDYCLENMLSYNHLHYESMPDLFIKLNEVLPKKEANWWSDNTAKPKNWNKMTRKEKADFFRKGSYIKNGLKDMNYFFFEYRSDAIKRFIRESWEAVHKIRPDIEVSAAVFKNPQVGGRFIGQRWRDFAPWINIMMPMSYRSHFQGDFETFLKLLEEYSRYEVKWAKGLTHLYLGITAHYIYREEYEPLNNIYNLLNKAKNKTYEKNWNKNIQRSYQQIKKNLSNSAPSLEVKISSLVKKISEKDLTSVIPLLNEIDTLRKNPPPGFYPGEKLKKAIEAVRRGGVEGVVIFAASHIENKKLWSTLEEAFSEPSRPPDKALPIQTLQIEKISNDEKRIDKLEKMVYFFQITSIILAVLFLATIFISIKSFKRLKNVRK